MRYIFRGLRWYILEFFQIALICIGIAVLIVPIWLSAKFQDLTWILLYAPLLLIELYVKGAELAKH